MLYLTFTMVSSVDLAHYGVLRAKDWVFMDYGTRFLYFQQGHFSLLSSTEVHLA